MSNALVPVHVKADLSWTEQKQLAEWAHKSGEFKSLKSPAHAMLLMSYGRELGFGPATSLQLVYSVNGTPSLKANTIAALLKQVKWQGTQKPRYDYRVLERSAQVCRIEFFERNDEGKMESRGVMEYTMEDARLAGFDKNPTYKKFPKNMLFARAITEGARTYAPDCLGGIVPYTPEELGYKEPEDPAPEVQTPPPGEVVDAEYVLTTDPQVSEEEYASLSELVEEKGRNLQNLLAQIGADPNDPRGMSRSQYRSIKGLLENL